MGASETVQRGWKQVYTGLSLGFGRCFLLWFVLIESEGSRVCEACSWHFGSSNEHCVDDSDHRVSVVEAHVRHSVSQRHVRLVLASLGRIAR